MVVADGKRDVHWMFATRDDQFQLLTFYGILSPKLVSHFGSHCKGTIPVKYQIITTVVLRIMCDLPGAEQPGGMGTFIGGCARAR